MSEQALMDIAASDDGTKFAAGRYLDQALATVGPAQA